MSHIQAKFQASTVARGQQRITSPKKPRLASQPRTPHITKLMALAIRLDELLATGQVKDQAEIARTAGITRARVTQIMNLTNLAPDIQQALLLLAKSTDLPRLREGDLRLMLKQFSWKSQRKRWTDLVANRAKMVSAFE